MRGFAALNVKCTKVFVIQISQNVSQASGRITLPLMPVSPIIRDALMILKIPYILLSLDSVQPVPYNS